MKLSNYVVIGIFMLSLTGCSLFSGEEDVIEVAPSPDVKNELAIQKIWQHDLANHSDVYSLLGPNSYRGVIYAANRTGQVRAINQLNGETLWSTNLADSQLFKGDNALLSGGISVDANYVYVGSERAIVYTLNRTTGKLVWEKLVNGEVLSRPTSSGSKLMVYTANGYLLALNKNNGKQLWDTAVPVPSLSVRGNSTPKIAHNTVIIGDAKGQVNAFSLSDGELVWQQRIAMPLGSSELAKLNDVNTTPIVEGNLIYAAAYNGNIAAFDLNQSKIVWKEELSTTHNFAQYRNKLVIVDQNDNVVSIAKNNGAISWKQTSLLNRQLTDPVVYQGYIVVGDFEGYLYWLNANSGKIIAKTEVNSSGILATPIVVNNQLIVQAKNGKIYAFKKN